MTGKRALLLCWVCGPGCHQDTSGNEPSGPQFSFLTQRGLLGVAAPDPSHVWTVGYNAVVLHSNDGGNKWSMQEVPVAVDLFDVCFTSAQRGWIVGKYATVLHTVDGGKHWTQLDTGCDERLFAVDFVDDRTGWIIGPNGTILHTRDEGLSWVRQGPQNDLVYNGLCFVDNATGWVVGEFGTILHTRDGGVTWSAQHCADIVPVVSESEWETPVPSLYGVYFSDPQIGWAVGLDGIVIHTRDGGVTWRQVSSDAETNLYAVVVRAAQGWVVGSKGTYMISRDGGQVWKTQDQAIRTKFWLRDIAFANDTVGWAVGSLGTIVSTRDGGLTWRMISGVAL